MQLPADLTPEPLDLGDLDELTGFVQRVAIAESGRHHFTRNDLATEFARFGFDPQRNGVVLRDPSGSMVAAEWVTQGPPYVTPHAIGFVAPERTGEGIGTWLLDWARGVAESKIDDAPAGARVSLAAWVDAAHPASMALMVGSGMAHTRFFLEMRIDFTETPPRPELPDGLVLRTFSPGVDDEAVYRTIDEASRDHFGHVDRPYEVGLHRLRQRMAEEGFDPSLWWYAVDGDDIAGVNLCHSSTDGDESVGYVGNLSVRRPWRGRGLAAALLQIAFHEFASRGKTAATLQVDADNITGATRLYSRAGMRETERFAVFETELRPGKELAVR